MVMLPERFLVFDVESTGLHGGAFAVGWVVVERSSRRWLADGLAFAVPREPGEWVREHVLPNLPKATYSTPRHVRDVFWEVWEYWREEGAWLAADVPWPVEARFLAACVDDAPERRAWVGPYPLVDVASVRLARGLDPLAEVDRLPVELPEHNPLADARQSARLLLEALALGSQP